MEKSIIAFSLCCVVGCASTEVATIPGTRQSHGECVARMYAARHPHAAVDWSIYNYCMKRAGERL
jgi:hypothetical protein